MAEPIDETKFTPDERERDLLARLAKRRLELQMRGAGQLSMGVAEASRLVWDWMREPPELDETVTETNPQPIDSKENPK